MQEEQLSMPLAQEKAKQAKSRASPVISGPNLRGVTWSEPVTCESILQAAMNNGVLVGTGPQINFTYPPKFFPLLYFRTGFWLSSCGKQGEFRRSGF